MTVLVFTGAGEFTSITLNASEPTLAPSSETSAHDWNLLYVAIGSRGYRLAPARDPAENETQRAENEPERLLTFGGGEVSGIEDA